MDRLRNLSILSLLLATMLLCAACGQAVKSEAEPAAPVETEQNTETNEEEPSMPEKAPVATITMENGGVITLELYYDVAPNTVKNYISLSNSGFYDGTIFHRVIPGFMIQGGDPDGTGTGGPGYRIKGEFTNNHVKNDISHERGVISMARQGNQFNPAAAYNTAGSQFFIMHADSNFLDRDYAAFGRVLTGLDVVDAIASTPTDANDKPLAMQKIASVRVETFGFDYGEPEKITD